MYKYPEEIPKLRAEITKVIKDDLSNLNKDTIEEFEYLVWFIKECQRMENSSSGTLNYRCYEDLELDGVKIKAGTDILYNIHGIHHHKDQWIDPHKFIPERFNPESKYFKTPSGMNRNQMSFMPFSVGPRNCPGGFISNIQLKIFVIVMAMKINWTLDESGFVTKSPSFGTMSKSDLIAIVK